MVCKVLMAGSLSLRWIYGQWLARKQAAMIVLCHVLE